MAEYRRGTIFGPDRIKRYMKDTFYMMTDSNLVLSYRGLYDEYLMVVSPFGKCEF